MIKFKKLHDEAMIPTRATDGSAGFDLYALDSSWYIGPGEWKKIRTGVALNVGKGNVGLVCPRSGLAAKYGVTVLNAPGIIDEDYRGEVCVLLQNISAEEFYIPPWMRIAQLVIVQCSTDAVEVDELDETVRGSDGFGSTGA